MKGAIIFFYSKIEQVEIPKKLGFLLPLLILDKQTRHQITCVICICKKSLSYTAKQLLRDGK
ncbi:Uncharacterized protein BM_BM17531 [Brugia malayi]|uniref:Uncharacterized protein n=1 Tax=Brugia malayi TaxID=6279 RepID=A0A4E9FFN9_BRUMA|nr:Uncharacterized protein BM_BM17531 [Brugia malayi]VIO94548.1 Uncharacterized protein BM_BM17531 [Brugia malayi]